MVLSSERIVFLKQSPIFNDLPEVELRSLAEISNIHRFKKGEYILLEGEEARYLHIVQEGKVKVFKQSSSGRDFIIGVFHPGDIIGEVALFDNKPYSVSAQAIDDATVLTLEKDKFLLLAKRNPGVIFHLATVTAERIKNAYDRLLDLATDHVEQRLSKVLLMLSAKCGETLPFTRQEIAEMAGTTTETTIRVMNRLKDSGIISCSRGLTVIVNEEKLRLLSDGPPLAI